MTTQPMPAPQKRSWWPLRWWGWVTCGLVLAAAIGTVEYLWYTGQREDAVAQASASARAQVEAEVYGPQALVTQYLSQLEQGEVAQAWALATGVVTYQNAGATPLALTADHAEPLLTNLLYQGLDAHVATPQITSVDAASGTAVVEASYQLGDSAVTARYRMSSTRDAATGAIWWEFTDAPLASVTFPDQPTAGTWTVAGVDLTTLGAPANGEGFTVLAAPGTYSYSFTPGGADQKPTVTGTLDVKDGTETLTADG